MQISDSKQVDKILEKAQKTIANYAVEKHKDNVKNITKKIKELEKMKVNLSDTMKEIRNNWDKLEGLVATILDIEDQLSEIKVKVNSQEKSGDNLPKDNELTETLRNLNNSRVGYIKEYFNSMGSFGKKAESDFNKQVSSNKNANMRFIPMHNLMYQLMDKNSIEINENIYNLKIKKMEDLQNIKNGGPYNDEFLEEWKNDIKNGDYPEETKNVIKNNNHPIPIINSICYNLNFLKEALDYNPKDLSPEFIQEETIKKALELNLIDEKIKKETKLTKKLDKIIDNSNVVYSQSLTASLDKIEDFEAEVNKSIENPEKYPPQITRDRLDLEITKDFCTHDILLKSTNALNQTNKILQREKEFKKSPAFDMFG
jgi:hypothetical protein